MGDHLLHAGLAEVVGAALAVFVLGAAVGWAVETRGGASRVWVRRWAATRARRRHAHRARRPHPRLAAAVLAARFYLTRFTIPRGTR